MDRFPMIRRAATQALARLSAAAATSSRSAAAPISTSARALAEEGGAVPAGLDVFKEKWAQVAPSTLNLPEFPSNFLEPEEAGTEAGAEEKFTVKVFTPTGTAAEGKVSAQWSWVGKRSRSMADAEADANRPHTRTRRPARSRHVWATPRCGVTSDGLPKAARGGRAPPTPTDADRRRRHALTPALSPARQPNNKNNRWSR